ncbi:hypothetical protein [Dyadobacter psychrotolerans]|uniref:Uncharacterized protein n=1 Tax=Dyadobacter psychrotolerans TaxID=2541721 RepID=A0A4R5DCK7_9BACT|nr:hypothetical protein [Dyadobacter psychrotolerans]TDE10717.1 hypothetical protein E0F88_26955 [Dyadobacter psychrotolerans]
MKKSNIFVHIELSKLVSGLSTDTALIKDYLKSQAGYFNIISSKYFSDELSDEWEQICSQMKDKGPKTDSEGNIIASSVINTIEHISVAQCVLLVTRIKNLQQKVKEEFE